MGGLAGYLAEVDVDIDFETRGASKEQKVCI
jgi:hypothetical protein